MSDLVVDFWLGKGVASLSTDKKRAGLSFIQKNEDSINNKMSAPFPTVDSVRSIEEIELPDDILLPARDSLEVRDFNPKTPAKHVFLSSEWMRCFNNAKSSWAYGECLYTLRRFVGLQTIHYYETGSYFIHPDDDEIREKLAVQQDSEQETENEHIDDKKSTRPTLSRVQLALGPLLEHLKTETIVGDPLKDHESAELPAIPADLISVEDCDCLFAAKKLIDEGYRPAVLNMANRFCPGGGFLGGDGAQEENLCRRSFLYKALTLDRFHPIDEAGCLYTTNVLVFRDTEASGYKLLRDPYFVDIISADAPVQPPLRQTNEGIFTTKEVAEIFINKIKLILAAGITKGKDAIVLSAFGCGAFQNPPDHISLLFAQVLKDPLYAQYKKVVFAIIDDHNTGRMHNPEGNFTPFRKRFERSPTL